MKTILNALFFLFLIVIVASIIALQINDECFSEIVVFSIIITLIMLVICGITDLFK
jgi:hypothetical protein